jgi:hypothetical protein
MIALLFILACPQSVVPIEGDADGDGLSDFHETHKYGTDPHKVDNDGDGLKDSDWSERRNL